MAPKQNFLKTELYDGPSVNLRPLFNSNMTQLSVIKRSQNCTWPLKVVFLAYPKIGKMHAKQIILTFLAMLKTQLLMVLVQF